MQQIAKTTINNLKLTTRMVFSNNFGFSKDFKSKEQAEEKMYFDKEESNSFLTVSIISLGRVIQNLLKKLDGDSRIQSHSEVAGKDEELFRAKVMDLKLQ